MLAFLARRVASGLLTVVAATAATFVVFQALVGPRVGPPDGGLLHRLGEQLSGVFLHLDLGETRTPPIRDVGGLLVDRFPVTLQLLAGAALVALAVGVPAGVLAARRRRSGTGRALTVAASLAQAAPVPWVGLMLIYALTPDIGLVELPFLGRQGAYVGLTSDPFGWLGAMILPWVVCGLPLAALTMRAVQSAMLDVQGAEWLQTARGKGVPEGVVQRRHALRSAGVPVAASLSLQAALLVNNTILVETIFNVPGVGQLARQGLLDNDLQLLQGTVIASAVVVVVVSLLSDLALAVLDPRIRAT